MKTKMLIGLLLAALFAGCAKHSYVEQSEKGEICEVAYMPSGHGTGVGTGFSTGGDAVFTSSSVDIPERYAVVFKCQHGKFAIDGDRGEWLYKHFEKGQSVTIHYLEDWVIGKYGESNLVHLHFVSAELAR